jgi:tetrahydromethanopterin S-methyltransferase subunit A
MGASVEDSETADIAIGVAEAVAHLRLAAAAKKCWACGCLRHALETIERAVPASARSEVLQETLVAARTCLVPERYECLGCDVCFPAIALNALGEGIAANASACPTEKVEARVGWPPLPGSYRVLRYGAPVAVCTLNDDQLADRIARSGTDGLAIVGTLHTENLGIERLVTNVIANPHIRFVVVCGTDSRQRIGHLPGQSLVSLSREGVDERQRIKGAAGKRPVLRNLDGAAIDHFRRAVEVIDLVGKSDVKEIGGAVQRCAERDPGPAETFAASRVIAPTSGSVPEKMVSDPAGYFVIFVDRVRKLVCMEHYANSGVLTVVIEGTSAAEVYLPAIHRRLVSRLDHAAYLGRELARAEQTLSSGERYVQDAAPEQVAARKCGCESGAACC